MSNRSSTVHQVTTVRALIDHMAEREGNETFVIAPETKRQLTFEALQQRAIELACRLRSLGLSKGEKVAVMLDNGLFTAELVLGAMYGGFVPVPLNLGAGRSQLEYILDHSETKLVFVSQEYRDSIAGVMGQLERQIEVIPAQADNDTDWGETQAGNRLLPALRAEDDALLMYTSGSTGQPKGVVISHRSILAEGANTVNGYRLGPEDRFFPTRCLRENERSAPLASLMASRCGL